MLMAASWPSNRLAAVTIRILLVGTYGAGVFMIVYWIKWPRIYWLCALHPIEFSSKTGLIPFDTFMLSFQWNQAASTHKCDICGVIFILSPWKVCLTMPCIKKSSTACRSWRKTRHVNGVRWMQHPWWSIAIWCFRHLLVLHPERELWWATCSVKWRKSNMCIDRFIRKMGTQHRVL